MIKAGWPTPSVIQHSSNELVWVKTRHMREQTPAHLWLGSPTHGWVQRTHSSLSVRAVKMHVLREPCTRKSNNNNYLDTHGRGANHPPANDATLAALPQRQARQGRVRSGSTDVTGICALFLLCAGPSQTDNQKLISMQPVTGNR